MARDTTYDDQLAPAPKKKAKLAPKKRSMSSKAMEPKRIPQSAKAEVPESERPSAKMKKRQSEKEEKTSLGEGLTKAAIMLPPGTGMIGRALKAGVSGAAAGATLGETLAKLQQEKIEKGKEAKQPDGTAVEPASLSGAAIEPPTEPKKKKRKREET